MRGLFSVVALLVVLAIVGINVRNELHAQKALLPAAAGSASASASSPFGGSSSPNVAQFQQELNKAMQNGADSNAARASDADAASR